MVNGQLLQMNKTYSHLKQKQKTKINEWMYEAYKKQINEKLSNEQALQYVYGKIDEAKIWIPWHEIEKHYYSRKNHFKKRLATENIPQHIRSMEHILNRATAKIDSLEKKIEEFEAYQSEIQKLEAYYASQQWKDDFELEEKGQFPKDIRRGVLSEDGIYNLLERNKELLDRIRLDEERD